MNSCLLTAALLACPLLLSAAENWPQFRGAGGSAIAPKGSPMPPAEFGPTRNVVWQSEVPAGHSSPVLWGTRIFLSGFENGKLLALCLDRATGRELWRRTVPAAKVEEFHRTGSPAASTPCTDGERVWFHFGSFGIWCLDFAGRELWRREIPPPNNDFGAATSPVISDDRLILVRDEDTGSSILALDGRSGRELWRTPRPGFFRGHSTPFVWEHDGRKEIVVTGSVHLTAYDPATGRELWRASGLSRVANATPTAWQGMLFASSWNIGADATGRLEMPPFDEFAKANDKNGDGRITEAEFPSGQLKGRFSQIDANKDGSVTRAEWEGYQPVMRQAENALLAIRPGGSGDITKSHVAWKKTRGLPYVPSPVWLNGRIYTIKNGGMASCFEASTGREVWLEERVGVVGDFYASPVAAGDRLYLASQKGTVVVLAAQDEFKVLARNELGEAIFATPAIADGRLYLRTSGHLYCFGEVLKP